MDLTEIQARRERLKPFRQILNDLDAAVEETAKIQGDKASLEMSLPQLRQQKEELETEIEKAKVDLVKCLENQEAIMSEHKNKMIGLNDDLSRIHSEIDVLLQEKRDLSAEVEKIRRANEVIAQAETAKVELQQMKSAVAVVQAELERVRQLKADEQAEIEKVKNSFVEWKKLHGLGV